MYLFFDTETTGLPRNWKAPVSDLKNWPRLVQLAWLLYDDDGKEAEAASYIIKPDDYTIPPGSSKIHGITTERALAEGAEIGTVLHEFKTSIDQADFLVAHNMSFDDKIVGAEFVRCKMGNAFMQKKRICTMKSSTDFCGIDGPYGYKWPTLTQLHQKLFGSGFNEAHDASVDIKATAKCFWELRRLGVV